MKLYATITTSRDSQKQGIGDDKWLEIELSLGNKRIGRIIFDYQGGKSFSLSYEKIAIGRSSDGSKIIDSYDFDCGCEQGVYACSDHAKAKKLKGEYDPTCVLCENGEEPGHEH